MILKNKEDGLKYRVSSEQAIELIRIFATPCNPGEGKPFVAYYSSLKNLLDDWEDID